MSIALISPFHTHTHNVCWILIIQQAPLAICGTCRSKMGLHFTSSRSSSQILRLICVQMLHIRVCHLRMISQILIGYTSQFIHIFLADYFVYQNMSSIHQATQKYVTKRSRTMSQVPETEFKRPSKRIGQCIIYLSLLSDTLTMHNLYKHR